MTSEDRPAADDAPRVAEHVRALADRLREASGDTVDAVLLYGSHLLRTSPDRHSAVDFIVIVSDYRAFYGALAERGMLHRPVGVMTALARRLPPNVLAFAPDDGRAGIAKYLLVTRVDFEAALGAEARDHFLLGRLLQRIGFVWTRDRATLDWIRGCIAGAHGAVLRWMAPYLSGTFTTRDFGRRMIEVCYQGEVRPESKGRADRVFDAQADYLVAALGPVLDRAADEGVLTRRGDAFALTSTVDDGERRRVRRYFSRSKRRTTTRWLKHTVTFVDWLPYIVRKVERHSGRTIHLTRLERALPVIFLWPRVFYVLATRPRREIHS